MTIPTLLLVLCSAAASQPSDDGRITGVVVNATDASRPVAEAEVVLRVELYGQLVPAAQTTSDRRGRFVFRDLPLHEKCEYLPGANWQGVHYPGRRIRLTPDRPRADVVLAVHDAVTQPNPLVIRRHEITVRPQLGALYVSESITVDNPTLRSYVGQPDGRGDDPVTMQLSVPPDFDKLTFRKEFFGRRFAIVDGKLVTTIPWTPGQRELEFEYVLHNTRARRIWERKLDLPCSCLTLSVITDKPGQVRCDLPAGPIERDGPLSRVSFTSAGRTMPAGHVVRLEVGELPVSWRASSKCLALLVLVLLVAGAGLVMMRPVGLSNRKPLPAESPSHAMPPADPTSARRQRSAPLGQRRCRQAKSKTL